MNNVSEKREKIWYLSGVATVDVFEMYDVPLTPKLDATEPKTLIPIPATNEAMIL